jgi:Tetratricopeptide repeat
VDALARFEEAIIHQREVGDRGGEAWTLSNIGMVYIDLDRPADSLEFLHESVSVCREVGDRLTEGNSLFSLLWHNGSWSITTRP